MMGTGTSAVIHYNTKLRLIIAPVILLISYFLIRFIFLVENLHPAYNDAQQLQQQFTIRVNTYRRNDLLKQFLDHYSECSIVHEIQVVWSDQKNSAPVDWLKNYPKDKIKFEIQATNSLSNRFKQVLPMETEAVLSIDDDIIIPCASLADSFQVWLANKRTLVGFSPRMNAFDTTTGHARYLRWQHTWWSGLYSIILTKVSFLHRDYLAEYFRIIPPHFLQYIDEHRNCEDLAMAYVVASASKLPPVWALAAGITETSTSGISSAKDHFIQRGRCLDELSRLGEQEGAYKDAPWTEDSFISTSKSVWVTAYQKYVFMSAWPWSSDLWTLFNDPK